MERMTTPADVKAQRLEDAKRALILAKRLREAAHMRADMSTFSALNIDFARQTSTSSALSETDSSSFARQLSSSMMAKVKLQADAEKLRLGLRRTAMFKPASQQVVAAVEPPASLHINELLRFRAVETEEKPSELADFAAALLPPRETTMASSAMPVAGPELEARPPSPVSASPTPMTPKDIPAMPPGVFVSPKTGSPRTPYSPYGQSGDCSAQLTRAVSSEGADGNWRSQPAEEPSALVFRPRRQLSENEEIKRSVQSLLNKVCPENVTTIVERIAAIKVNDATQLEIIIEAIFRKALTESHYCETYADLVFSLKSVFPQFPSQGGGKPMTFKSSVLNVCQNEFEELVMAADTPTNESTEDVDPEEVEFQRRKRKDRMRANMKFIGHLFLRQLLSAKVIGAIICELVLCAEQSADYVPEEHAIECACELLMNIGYTLEQLPTGFQALQLVCNRLFDLKARKTPEGKPAYCKRMVFMMQDLLETRAADWVSKTFKSSAKTKEEIRMEQQRDLEAKSRGIQSPVAEHVVAGQRPMYISSTNAATAAA